ncbi:hypothetical protein ACFQMM_03190 [Saliphagus sp. GCM10025308]
MGVDEARADDAPVGVDPRVGVEAVVGGRRDSVDATVDDADRAADPGRARAVDDPGVLDE